MHFLHCGLTAVTGSGKMITMLENADTPIGKHQVMNGMACPAAGIRPATKDPPDSNWPDRPAPRATAAPNLAFVMTVVGVRALPFLHSQPIGCHAFFRNE